MGYQDRSEIQKYLVAMQLGELVIGFLGNLTACTVILCSPSMRTLTDFYLLNLAISDLIFTISKLFWETYMRLYQKKYRYVFNSKAAYFAGQWINFTSGRVSALTITVFSVERYLAVCHPFVIQSMDKKSRITKVISAIWLLVALEALLVTIWMLYGEETWYSNHDRAARTEVLLSISRYLLIERIIFFFLPMLLITVLYILIGIKLYRSSIERQNITSQAGKTNNKTLMMFAVIIVIFFISWAPGRIYLLIICLYPYWDPVGLEYLINIDFFTYPLYPALNPIIYVIMSEKFRKAFKDLLLESRKKLSDWTCTLRDTQTAEVSLGMV